MEETGENYSTIYDIINLKVYLRYCWKRKCAISQFLTLLPSIHLYLDLILILSSTLCQPWIQSSSVHCLSLIRAGWKSWQWRKESLCAPTGQKWPLRNQRMCFLALKAAQMAFGLRTPGRMNSSNGCMLHWKLLEAAKVFGMIRKGRALQQSDIREHHFAPTQSHQSHLNFAHSDCCKNFLIRHKARKTFFQYWYENSHRELMNVVAIVILVFSFSTI